MASHVNLDEFFGQYFECLQRPEFWFGKATQLRRSARYLYKATLADIRRYEAARKIASRRLSNSNRQIVAIRCREPEVLPIFMLHGLSLENAFKALLVSRDPNLISSKKISPKLREHSLVQLAHLTQTPLSNDEKQILDWVSEVVIWKGRYQLPTKADDLNTFWALDHTPFDYIKLCNHTVEAVFRRLTEALQPSLPKRRYQYPLLF